MKTDLRRILSVSGQHGLYRYLAQARNGAVAENLADKKRTVFTGSSRITTLADIAIYTSEGEMKLSDVFLAIKAALGDAERRIVLLHAVTGMKHREIAALLELPLPTVLSKYHRALKKMRSCLEGDDAR